MKTTTADSNAPSFMLPSGPDPDTFSAIDYNDWFGLLSNEDLVIVRPYSDDDDDRVLEELRPKYIVMYDPEPAFVRRVEVRRRCEFEISADGWIGRRRIERRMLDLRCEPTFSCTRTRSRSSGTSAAFARRRTLSRSSFGRKEYVLSRASFSEGSADVVTAGHGYPSRSRVSTRRGE